MKKLSVLASAVALTASSLFGDIAVGKGLTVSGYLDLVYTNVSDDLGNADTSGFNATTAEIDFSFDFGNGLSATIDLEGNVNDNATSDTNIEQARIDYAFGDSSITIGKFDTPIGLEALEAPDLYQYSSSITTADLQFTQHTGIMYGYDNGMFNLNLGVVNSINDDNDNNDAGDSDDDLSYLAKVGVTPNDAIALNLAYSAGDEDGGVDNTTNPATLLAPNEFKQFSVDASWSDYGWTVGAEYVDREVETAAGASTETDGYMLMANYMFTEQFGLTVRHSASDIDGGNEKSEFTICPSYAVTPNWFLLVEYRMDEEETNAGAKVSESDTIAVETVLTF